MDNESRSKNLRAIQKIGYEEFTESFKGLRERTKELTMFPEDEFLQVDGVCFNISFVFDDFSEYKNECDKDVVVCVNLVFAEIEFRNKSISSLRRTFPSFFKLQSKIQRLKEEAGEYVEIFGDYKTPLTQKEVDNEISLKLKDADAFKDYTNKYIALKPLYSKFLEEVEVYLDNQHFFTVENTGIKEGHSNGKRTQSVIIKSETNIFKIDILSESHDFQSYAKLFVKDDGGWSLVVNKNPKKDFRIDISGQNGYKEDAFDRIINNLTDIALRYDTPIIKPKKKKKKIKHQSLH